MEHPFCPYPDAKAFCQVCDRIVEKHTSIANSLEITNLIKMCTPQQIYEGLDKIKETDPLQYAMIIYFFDNL